MKARKLLAIPLFAAVLVTGACNVGKNAEEGPGEGPTQAAITAQDINTQDRQALVEGGEIRLPVDDVLAQWNGLQTDGNESTMSELKAPMQPTYFDYDAKGTPIWNPDFLAAEPTAEGDPLVVTYKLNPKAVWGDGTAINVKDFQATWNACNGKDKDFNCASTEGFDQIASIEQGADELEVKMTYKSTYPDWTGVFSSVYRADSVKDANTFNKGWLENPDMDWFSGPFVIADGGYNKGQGNVTMVPNPRWWGDKPLLEKISYKHVTAEATAASFVNGEIDAFDIGVDPDAFQRASAVADAQIRKAAGPNWRHFTFNGTAGLLKDVKMRQVVVMGLNRTEIANSDLAGLDWPATPLNNHTFMASQEGYVDTAAATGIDYNVDKAKSELDAMGWKVPEGAADGMRMKDGKKLTIKFSRITGVPVSENEATQAQNQLKQIGIDLQIVDETTESWIESLSTGKFEIMAFSWIGTPYPFSGISQIYGTKSGSNFSKVSVPEVDALTKQIAVNMDPQSRIDQANQADKLIWENVFNLPLYQRPELVGTKANLANYGAFGLSSADWVNIGFTKA